jgi:hypothetical protein
LDILLLNLVVVLLNCVIECYDFHGFILPLFLNVNRQQQLPGGRPQPPAAMAAMGLMTATICLQEAATITELPPASVTTTPSAPCPWTLFAETNVKKNTSVTSSPHSKFHVGVNLPSFLSM